MINSTVGKSNDKMAGVTVPVSRYFSMLSEATTSKEVKKWIV